MHSSHPPSALATASTNTVAPVAASSASSCTEASTASVLLRGGPASLRHPHELSLVPAAGDGEQHASMAVLPGSVPSVCRACQWRERSAPHSRPEPSARDLGGRVPRGLLLSTALPQRSRVPRALSPPSHQHLGVHDEAPNVHHSGGHRQVRTLGCRPVACGSGARLSACSTNRVLPQAAARTTPPPDVSCVLRVAD